MKINIRPVREADWRAVPGIFNYYVLNSFAAYLDRPVDESFFRTQQAGHPSFPFAVVEAQGRVVGFGRLRPFHPASTMRRTATLSYFLHPEFTGKGIGTALLEYLLQAGAALGVQNFLAHVCSLNTRSIRFHLRHGFRECGRFLNAGVKNGQSFDVVWFQRQQA
jgi:phosphinothricin acetyltransferase